MLIPELRAAIERFKPEGLYFAGDNDTGHNYIDRVRPYIDRVRPDLVDRVRP